MGMGDLRSAIDDREREQDVMDLGSPDRKSPIAYRRSE